MRQYQLDYASPASGNPKRELNQLWDWLTEEITLDNYVCNIIALNCSSGYLGH